MKRKTANRCGKAEMVANSYRNIAMAERDRREINPIFLRAHYSDMEVKNDRN